MNRLFVCLLCIACLPAIGETRKDIIDAIRAKEGVTDVGIVREGSFMEGKLGLSYYSEIVWLRQVGNVVKKETGTLIVKEQGVEGRETVVGWLNDVPQFLQPPREQEAIGDEADILAAIGTKVIKPTVEIGKDAAKVTGYEESGADLVPVAFMVHLKDGQLVSVRLKDTATKVESGLEPRAEGEPSDLYALRESFDITQIYLPGGPEREDMRAPRSIRHPGPDGTVGSTE